MDAVIETVGLSKHYGTARGIADLTLAVERGEVFGFLGPNGAGKTTTIRTLLDLMHPTSGTARIFGLDSRRDSRAIRARLGNLPGDFAYEPRMTARELLTFFARLRGLAGSAAPSSSRRASRPISTARCTTSRAATARRSGSSRRSSTTPSCSSSTSRPPVWTRSCRRSSSPSSASTATAAAPSFSPRTTSTRSSASATASASSATAGSSPSRRSRRCASARCATSGCGSPARVKPELIARLPGIREVVRDGDTLRFGVHGEIDAVVKEIARHRVADLEITRPTLEELFLAYYGATP